MEPYIGRVRHVLCGLAPDVARIDDEEDRILANIEPQPHLSYSAERIDTTGPLQRRTTRGSTKRGVVELTSLKTNPVVDDFVVRLTGVSEAGTS